MRKVLLCAALALAAVRPAAAEIVSKKVEYAAGETTLNGYLSHTLDGRRDKKRPGILVVHEWWGVNDYARTRADMLARLGYVAMAVDMYGDGKQADHPKDAGAFSKAAFANFNESKARFQAALDYLKNQPSVDPDRIAVVGYCFGGAVALNMARAGADLKGAASFHGGLFAVKPAKKGAVKAKILVLTGADDMMAPPQQVEEFKKEMDAAGADYRVVSYPGAKHGFTNPEADEAARKFELPVGYDKKADKASWKELRKFLKEVFKQ